MTKPLPLLPDPTGNGWLACWDLFVLYATRLAFDRHGHLLADLSAALPDNPALHFARLQITDTRAREGFAKECDANPGSQRTIRQYLSAFSTALVDQLQRGAQATTERDLAYGTACLTTLGDVEPEMIPWLWEPYLVLKSIAMLDGDPSTGKSLFTLQLASSLSRGWCFPDQGGKPTISMGTPAHTVMLAAEDSLAYTMRPRIDACGGDAHMVHVLTAWKDVQGDEQVFSLDHMPILRQALEQYHPRLVIIDPIHAYMGDHVDIHRANDVLRVLRPLQAEAERYNCCILGIRHQGKSSGQGGGKAMMRGLGSIAFTGTARSGLTIEQHPTEKDLALLAHAKTNLGSLGRTQKFAKGGGVFAWAGITRITAEMIGGNARGPDPYAFFEAFCWLEEYLKDGQAYPAKETEDAMLEEGFKRDTVRRAKKMLGVVSKKMRDDFWTWTLPPIITTVSSVSTPTTVTSATSYPSNNSAPYGNVTLYASEGGREEDTEDTAVKPRAGTPIDARASSNNCASEASHCSDGRPHTWIGTDTGRLCSRCDAQQEQP